MIYCNFGAQTLSRDVAMRFGTALPFNRLKADESTRLPQTKGQNNELSRQCPKTEPNHYGLATCSLAVVGRVLDACFFS